MKTQIGKGAWRYWDSCAFIGFLGAEKERQPLCEPILNAARAGELLIVTSALTLTEVIKRKSCEPIGREKSAVIQAFFEHEWIEVRELHRELAGEARRLIWDNGLKPKDAVHLATALDAQCPVLHTFDDDLLRLDGKFKGLQICAPPKPDQVEFRLS